MGKLSHFDKFGRVRMVDVTGKPETKRRAKASVIVEMKISTLKKLSQNPKGDPFEIARIAGIAAAKRTSELIPLCHSLRLSHVDVQLEKCKNGLRISSLVLSTGPTGVEMEALTAAAVAALTVYDMCKGVDRGIRITELHLQEKSGGKSGTYKISSAP